MRSSVKKTTATIYHKKYYKAASNKFLSSSRQIKTSTHKSVFKKPIKQRNSPQINRSRNQGYNSVRQKIINMSAKMKDRNDHTTVIFGEELGNNLASFSALSPVFSSRIFYTLFVKIQKYLEIPRTDFGETSHNRRQAPKVSVT